MEVNELKSRNGSNRLGWNTDLILLNQYRSEKVLWDRNHPDFNIKSKKEAAWQRIATSINSSKEECENTISNLKKSRTSDLQRGTTRLPEDYYLETLTRSRLHTGGKIIYDITVSTGEWFKELCYRYPDIEPESRNPKQLSHRFPDIEPDCRNPKHELSTGDGSTETRYLYLFLIVAVLLVAVAVVVFPSDVTNPKCSDNILQDFPQQSEGFRRSMKNLMMMDFDSMNSISVVLMHTPNSIDSARCIARKLATDFSCRSGEGDTVIITPQDLNRDVHYGDILYKYLENANNTFIVENLNDVWPESSQIFHSLCDDTTPPKHPTLCLFLISTGERSTSTPKFAARDILLKAWSDLPDTILPPLLSRILGFVYFVEAENVKTIPHCILNRPTIEGIAIN